MKSLSWRLLLSICAGLFALDEKAFSADATKIEIRVDQPGAAISKTLFGVFFEDINFGADGGLYPELVKNRSFEFADPFVGWKKIELKDAVGGIGVISTNPCFVNNPNYARITVEDPGMGFAMGNEGFRGMGFKKDAQYSFSTYARLPKGGEQTLRIELVDPQGMVVGQTQLQITATSWTAYRADVTTSETVAKGALRIVATQKGVLDLDAISLLPKDTWKGRPGGLRRDLVQKLADLKPGFMRFPGGCIVEGRILANRYQWKNTIGPIEERKVMVNRWNDEFGHRATPDYYQSFGLGFFEYFQLCEDIGASPVPILNCGMACQFNSGELVPLAELDPYIQDALDLIEFANGPADSPWGRKRAAMGHANPFGLKMLGVGNEQWGPQYIERYTLFAKAIHARYPGIKLISGAGPSPDDDRFKQAWTKLRALNADIIDEHSYANPSWFLDNSHRYDAYDRHGPKVFMGEYAAQSDHTVSADNKSTWACALSEAAFITGLERNADVVAMSSYAPLFGNLDAWQWRPNLIWCDSLNVFGTAEYYVQQLFSLNRGDVILPIKTIGVPVSTEGKERFYTSAARDLASGEIILKVVNALPSAQSADVSCPGAHPSNQSVRITEIASSDLAAENSMENSTRVSPQNKTMQLNSESFTYTFPASSVTVLRLPASL